ncbi:MAG: beta-propeller fold lactonase family protein [Pseudacidovorax sp.]|nr:beta-propeller fold lactonase family protein [Pseudacidovorax sp.]
MVLKNWLPSVAAALVLGACGGGGGGAGGGGVLPLAGMASNSNEGSSNPPSGTSAPSTPSTYQVAGEIEGLPALGLVVQLNGAEEVAVGADGLFSFSTRLTSQASYAVTLKSGPIDPRQRCTLSGAAGTVGVVDVRVRINCAALPLRYAYAQAFDVDSSTLTTSNMRMLSYPIDAVSGELGATPIPNAMPAFDLGQSFVLHPAGRWGYVVTQEYASSGGPPTPTGGYRVSQYDFGVDGSIRASSLAALTWTDPVSTTGGRQLVVHPSGRFVYSVGWRLDSVAQVVRSMDLRVMQVDPVTGALSSAGSMEFAGGSGLLIEPSGRFAYSYSAPVITGSATPPNDTVVVYRIDSATGLLSRTAEFSAGLTGPAVFSPNGRFAYGVRLTGGSNPIIQLKSYSLDGGTGVLSEIAGSAITLAYAPSQLIVHPNGRLIYAMSTDSGIRAQRFAVDGKTGKASALTDRLPSPAPDFDPQGLRAYVLESDLGTAKTGLRVYQVDPTSGALTPGTFRPIGDAPSQGAPGPIYTFFTRYLLGI